MERVNRIVRNQDFKEHIHKIEVLEAEREFCRHNPAHLLDVARIAVILNEQEGYGLDLELIYAAALLHDIGRWQQYENGTDHALASAYLAPAILADCGFLPEESRQIVSAIETHRQSGVKEEKTLNGLVYRADKLSRPCYFCKQEKNCNWKDDKKNMELSV